MKLSSFLLIICSCLTVIPICADAGSFDYDGDGVNDELTEVKSNNSLHLAIQLSSIKKTQGYVIESIDGTILPSVHLSYEPGEIEIDSTYYSRRGQVYSEVYKWVPEKEEFILIKRITGERSDPISGLFFPTLIVERAKCCSALGNDSDYVIESRKEVQRTINAKLSVIANLLDKKRVDEAIAQVNLYDAVEYASVLNKNNLELLNNLAYFLIEKDNISSGIILEKIVKNYPSRIVAKLNLADVYWNLGQEYQQDENAKKLYKEYKELMIKRGMRTQIPKRVLIRSDN